MIEIGYKRLRKVRVKQLDPTTGKNRFVQKVENGEPVTQLVANEPVRATRGALDAHYGPDNGRKLVVSLKDGDILELRPQGRRLGVHRATFFDIYHWMIRSASDHERMAKLRDIKAKKEMRRAERRVRRPIK